MFTDSYLPSRDGVVNSILLTKQKLEEMGHEVIVFAPDPGNSDDREEGTQYFRSVAYRSYQGYRVPMFPTNKCQILEGLDVDVIHNQGLLLMALRGMFAGRSLRLPVVTSFHTMITEAVEYYSWLPLPREVMDVLFWRYLRSLLQRSEAVIAPTQAILDELMAYAPDIRKGEVIPTGVDCSRFRPDVDGSAIRERYGLEGKVILHLGRIAWEKNLDLVLESFKLLLEKDRTLRLMIVGSGPARDHYMEVAKSMGIGDEVIFPGFVADEELPMYYAVCDVFALASKFETQGLVVLEAMASGKAVACIDYRATAEIVNEGVDGFLFEESVESCSSTLEKALNAPDSIKMNARGTAERYSIDEMAERLVKVYEYAIEQKRERSGEPKRRAI
ncbi:MAG: glycosyltransferase family 4 protein [Methanomassiliicoccales archaeon]|nr:glycosyltransferase family 4 protein [Methanomassiliicoccales archaeon]NYT14655.1 glycosyltransferase family 4 protein [Methanomassiliicoccales archaeon]